MSRWRLADTDWSSWPDGLTVAETFAQAAQLGLEGVELGVYDTAVELSPERLTELRRCSDASGVPVVGLLLSLPSERWPHGALSGNVDRLVEQVRGCATTCTALGLPVLGLWPGADVGPADVVPALRRCVQAAGDVRIALEYKPGTSVADAATTIDLCAEVDGLGVLLDTGHAFAADEDPAEVVDRLGDLLLHVHLGDAALGGSDDDLPCGRVHDFGAVVSALDASPYGGVASFDLYGAISSGGTTALQAVRESRDHVLSRRA